jgi:tetratricopeptide (TPR) repeat protein
MAVLLVFAVILVTVAFRSVRRHDSNADLGRAMIVLQRGRLSDGATELAEVARRWPSAEAGRVAAILAANAEISKGNLDSAVLLIQQSLDSFTRMPEYLRQQLLFAWGWALEQKQDWENAAQKYLAAGALPGPFSGPSVLGEARASERLGETERAQQLYAKYVEKFPDLPDHSVVSEKTTAIAPRDPGPGAP